MKAIVQETYGAPEVLHLAEIDQPAIGADEVLVRVRAASPHIGDWHLMTGTPYLIRYVGFGVRAPKARVRGMDLAGTVAAVGARVTRFRVGDEVFGSGDGAFAEYARARADKLTLRPAALTPEQAAAVPTSACTALQALRDQGKVQPGQRVLIIGASGGVGLFAVQLARALGADVTGVCGPAKVATVRGLGADRVIDYTREDYARDERRYDLILDMVGDRPLARLRRLLNPRGTLVLVGGEGGGPVLGIMTRQLRAVLLAPFVRQRLRPLVAVTKAEDLQYLTGLIEAGKVAPVIDRTYPLGETPAAIRHLEGGHPLGKIVITV